MVRIEGVVVIVDLGAVLRRSAAWCAIIASMEEVLKGVMHVGCCGSCSRCQPVSSSVAVVGSSSTSMLKSPVIIAGAPRAWLASCSHSRLMSFSVF